jgi:hypothetical protein
MPRLVIQDNITTASIKYDFNNILIFSHSLYRKDADTNLPIPSAIPITAIGIGTVGNNVINPTIEKYSDTADNKNADKNNAIVIKS